MKEDLKYRKTLTSSKVSAETTLVNAPILKASFRSAEDTGVESKNFRLGIMYNT